MSVNRQNILTINPSIFFHKLFQVLTILTFDYLPLTTSRQLVNQVPNPTPIQYRSWFLMQRYQVPHPTSTQYRSCMCFQLKLSLRSKSSKYNILGKIVNVVNDQVGNTNLVPKSWHFDLAHILTTWWPYPYISRFFETKKNAKNFFCIN